MQTQSSSSIVLLRYSSLTRYGVRSCSAFFSFGKYVGNNFFQRRIFDNDIVDRMGAQNLTEDFSDFVTLNSEFDFWRFDLDDVWQVAQ